MEFPHKHHIAARFVASQEPEATFSTDDMQNTIDWFRDAWVHYLLLQTVLNGEAKVKWDDETQDVRFQLVPEEDQPAYNETTQRLREIIERGVEQP